MRRAESRYEWLEGLERLLAGRPAGWCTAELARELGVDPDTIRRTSPCWSRSGPA